MNPERQNNIEAPILENQIEGRERIKPIDIFSEPAIFRNFKPLQFIELYCRDEVNPVAVSTNRLFGNASKKAADLPQRQSHDFYDYFESPLPLKSGYGEYETLEEENKMLLKTAQTIVENIKNENNIDLNVEDVNKILVTASLIGNTREGPEANKNLTTEFVSSLLNDKNLRRTYLMFQEYYINPRKTSYSDLNVGHLTYKEGRQILLPTPYFHGASKDFSNFAISLESVSKRVTSNPQQHHSDYGFEFLLGGGLNREDFLYFISPDSEIQKRYKEKQTLMRDKVESIFSRRLDILTDVEEQITLDILRRKKGANFSKKDLEEMSIGELVNEGHITKQVALGYRGKDVESMKLKDFRIFQLEMLKKRIEVLFPEKVFTTKNLVSEATEAMRDFLAKEFNLDLETATTTDFQTKFCQKLGIPIYDPQGNMLWPEKISHEEIVGAESKNTRDALLQ